MEYRLSYLVHQFHWKVSRDHLKGGGGQGRVGKRKEGEEGEGGGGGGGGGGEVLYSGYTEKGGCTVHIE